MSRIAERFKELKNKSQKGLVVYIMGGDPDIETTAALIPFLEGLGVDLVEIGVPFSDPLADGPTIQEAGQRALGTRLCDLVNLVGELRSQVRIPLLMMTYYNPILRRGVDRLISEAVQAGVDGLIIPDLTPEEGSGLIEQCRIQGMDYVPLLAPTTTDERMAYLVSSGSGFLYYVSRTGTTGERSDVSMDLQSNLCRIRDRSSLPLIVGFGISSPEQAAQVTANADGVVIGSAVVKRIAEARGNLEQTKKSLGAFLSPIIHRLHTTGE